MVPASYCIDEQNGKWWLIQHITWLGLLWYTKYTSYNLPIYYLTYNSTNHRGIFFYGIHGRVISYIKCTLLFNSLSETIGIALTASLIWYLHNEDYILITHTSLTFMASWDLQHLMVLQVHTYIIVVGVFDGRDR